MKMKSGDHYASEFRKDGKAISTFPEELRIIVGFQTTACAENRQPDLSVNEVDDLLRSLKLEASWKRGLEHRPAEMSEVSTFDPKPAINGKTIADGYVLHLHARGVPITDQLVISIFGPGKKLQKLLTHVTFD